MIVGSKVVCFLLLGIPQSIFLASVIALSCALVVLLIIVCGLIWQRRRAVPSERIQGKEKVDFDGVKSSPDRLSNYEQALDPNTYMELKARPSNHEQSHVPTEYQSLQEILLSQLAITLNLIDSKVIILIFLIFYAYLYNYKESMLSSEI